MYSNGRRRHPREEATTRHALCRRSFRRAARGNSAQVHVDESSSRSHRAWTFGNSSSARDRALRHEVLQRCGIFETRRRNPNQLRDHRRRIRPGKGRSKLVLIKTTLFLVCLLFTFNSNAAGMQAASEATLASVRRSDAASRDANGKLQKLTPAEHMRRAAVYLSVRAFAEARDHWQTFIDNYPQ